MLTNWVTIRGMCLSILEHRINCECFLITLLRILWFMGFVKKILTTLSTTIKKMSSRYVLTSYCLAQNVLQKELTLQSDSIQKLFFVFFRIKFE